MVLYSSVTMRRETLEDDHSSTLLGVSSPLLRTLGRKRLVTELVIDRELRNVTVVDDYDARSRRAIIKFPQLKVGYGERYLTFNGASLVCT